MTERREPKLSHTDAAGAPRMVDTSGKPVTRRIAIARGEVCMEPGTLRAVMEGHVRKGDVLDAARVAGILAAKRTAELIPLCHPLPLDKVQVDIAPLGDSALEIVAEVRSETRTGVEMEALTAVSVAALTIFDMCKALNKRMIISDIHVVRKSGGRSGDFEFESPSGH